jgi:hypothetical protein
LNVDLPIGKKIFRPDSPGRKHSPLYRYVAGSAVAWGASSIHFHALHQESESSYDQPGNPRADSPLLLRRALEGRQHCQ